MTRKEEEEEGEMSQSAELCDENDVCVGSAPQNKLPENDEKIIMQPSSPLNIKTYDGAIQFQQSENAQDHLLPVALLVLLCVTLVAWVFYRHRKYQKEWQLASNLQLKQISQRNMQTKIQPIEEQNSNPKVETSQDETTRKSSNDTCKTMNTDIDRVRSIRAQQQKQHDIKSKLAKQQKRHVENEKKRMIYESLQHEDADQAYERRTQLIREEQSMLEAAAQQTPTSNDAEEAERRELLHMQNLEYEESLRRDQERLKQATIEAERCRKRATILQHAIHRLENAGIYSADLQQIINDSNKAAAIEKSDEDRIQVRLMLPSGKRVQATYSKCHSIGLIYDLALIILNYNQQDQELSTIEETTCIQSEERNRDEWIELFDAFTIKTTFPPQTFDEMDLTLEQCGLQRSVTLMIIVES